MRFLLFLFSLIGWVSCGLTGKYTPHSTGEVDVTIDSYGDIDLSNKTYCLVDRDFNPTFPLETKEFIDNLEQIFLLKGAHRIVSPQMADLLVVVSMGISDPVTHQVQIPIPVWGKTGISSVTTNTDARVYGIGNTIYGNANSTTRYNYDYGITGISSVQRNITQYLRYCNLFVYDNKKRLTTPISKTNIQSIGSSGDLREIMPYMLSAAYSGIGQSTEQKISLSLAMSSPPAWLKSRIIRSLKNRTSNSNQVAVLGVEFYSNVTRVHFRSILTSGTWMQVHPKTYLVHPNGLTYPLVGTSAVISPNRLWGNESFSNLQIYDFTIDFTPSQYSPGFYKVMEPYKGGRGWEFSFKL